MAAGFNDAFGNSRVNLKPPKAGSQSYTAKMTAQLVLQFASSEDVDSFDTLIRFEEQLISVLGKTAKVDGHDFGSGEMNIFILTQDPIATFALVRQTSESIRPAEEMRAAYRSLDREDYIFLWPPKLDHFDVA